MKKMILSMSTWKLILMGLGSGMISTGFYLWISERVSEAEAFARWWWLWIPGSTFLLMGFPWRKVEYGQEDDL